MTEDALLKAILANPDDDAPRLIYADWLDENGQEERAELIRVQIALAVADGCPVDDSDYCKKFNRWHAMQLRERELLQGPRPDLYENEVCWFHQGDGTDTWRILFRPQWRRGFVHAIICTAEDWIAHAAAILAAQPVREVTLTTAPTWGGRVGELWKEFNFPRWPRVMFTLPIWTEPELAALRRQESAAAAPR